MWHGGKAEEISSLFKMLNRNVGTDGEIHLEQFIIALTILSEAPWETKVPNLFRAFDLDGDGVVTRTELEYAMLTLFKVAAVLSNENYNLGPHSKTLASVEATAKYASQLTFKDATEDDEDALNITEFTTWFSSKNKSAKLIRALIEATSVAP
eukprot:TRINITY_DN11151_c0_g1_i1.p1 TRINITY_DN11151_c0_g1~~TRINITY_DN11151_c0_g1_i1.p1  ORF type:complete len:153 (-),score=40.99 TRINITY_DN11151_c0_g1_i1:231-689(-)